MSSATDLIKNDEGTIRVTGLKGVKWTVASTVSKNFDRGQPMYHPELGVATTLPESPEFSDLTLTTPALEKYLQAFNQWTEKYASRTDISLAGQIKGLTYTFTQCSIRSHTAFPGIDKNPGGGNTNVKQITLVLAIGTVTQGKEVVGAAA